MWKAAWAVVHAESGHITGFYGTYEDAVSAADRLNELARARR